MSIPIQEEKRDESDEFVKKIFDWKTKNYPKAAQDYKTPEGTFKIWDLIDDKAKDPALNQNPDKTHKKMKKN